MLHFQRVKLGKPSQQGGGGGGGVLENDVVSQPLTFTIITSEKNSPFKETVFQHSWGGSGEVGMVSQV